MKFNFQGKLTSRTEGEVTMGFVSDKNKTQCSVAYHFEHDGAAAESAATDEYPHYNNIMCQIASGRGQKVSLLPG